MADLVADFKRLRLYGMAARYAEGLEQGQPAMTTATALLTQLVQAEATDRATRSVRYQMHVARFAIHRDLASVDFDQAKVDRRQITSFATTAFTEPAENIVLIGGTGTGKTHLATALGVEAVTQHNKRVRFYSTVELVNTLEQEKASGRAGRLAHQLMHLRGLVDPPKCSRTKRKSTDSPSAKLSNFESIFQLRFGVWRSARRRHLALLFFDGVVATVLNSTSDIASSWRGGAGLLQEARRSHRQTLDGSKFLGAALRRHRGRRARQAASALARPRR